MSELRQQFTLSIIENLKQLREKISSANALSGAFLQEIFRHVHTTKGTAQTFGLEQPSRIAHELENLLVAVKNEQSVIDKQLLLESVTALENSFRETSAQASGALIEKIKTAASSKTTSTQILPGLPENILKPLSGSEKTTLSAAFRNAKNIYCLEVYFSLANFRERLLGFRQILEQNCEIIATLPASKKDRRIGFLFLTAGKVRSEDILDLTADFSPAIVFDIDVNDSDLLKISEAAAAHGEEIAARLGKQIEFEFFTSAVSLSESRLKIIFDALLHLIRNAVDHAIELPAERIRKNRRETGKIEVRFSAADDNLVITIADDGQGIDVEKVRSKAIEKDLIAEGEVLSEEKIIDLILSPEFSTAEQLTEISGRGVGLNAVKTIIENVGGKIKAESLMENGTIFEITLPLEN